MLAYILAVLVGTGSVGLYIAAFFFPELHRKQDFIWSGVGCFYALTLWIYAHEVTGGILVGQIASVSLIGWFAWQILKLRRQLIPVEREASSPNSTQLQSKLGSKKSRNVAAGEAKSTAVKQIEPKAAADRSINSENSDPTPTPSAIHTKRAQTAIAKQRATSIEIDRSHQQPTPLPKAIIEPIGEGDNEAWIKLEVKTAPAKSPENPSITPQPPAETAKPQQPQSITSPAKSPEPPQSPQSSTSQPPAETAKPSSSIPPAPPVIAKPELPAENAQPPASKAEPSAQNHPNKPIDVTPIESNLDEEANWE